VGQFPESERCTTCILTIAGRLPGAAFEAGVAPHSLALLAYNESYDEAEHLRKADDERGHARASLLTAGFRNSPTVAKKQLHPSK